MERLFQKSLSILLAAVLFCGTLALPAEAKDYYIISVSDETVGTAVVEGGETVTMKVTVSGASFNGLQAAVTYDERLFKLKSASGIAVDDNVETGGVIELYMLRNTSAASGTIVATLVFEVADVGETATGSFAFAYATVGDYKAFRAGDAVTAMSKQDSVTIEKTFEVSGKVTDVAGNPAPGIHVMLKKGNETVAEADSWTNDRGEFVLSYVHTGIYNLIAEEQKPHGRTMTVKVEVQANQYVGTITMPAANVSSRLEVEPGAPDVVVGGLEQVAEESEHQSEASDMVHVTISMAVEETEDLSEKSDDALTAEEVERKEAQLAIKEERQEIEVAGMEEALVFFDIDLTKTITVVSSEPDVPDTQPVQEPVKETKTLIEIIIPFETEGRRQFQVYRYHDGQVDILTTHPNGAGEHIVVEEGQITVYARFFSTYAISFLEGKVYLVEKIPNTIYMGESSVVHGDVYAFCVSDGYDSARATPAVTMGGKHITVKGTGTEQDPWQITGVTSDLVIESPKHHVSFQSADPSIALPECVDVHYGQNYTFKLPARVTATMQVGAEPPQKLTADASGKVTIPGKSVTDDIVVTLAAQQSGSNATSDSTQKLSKIVHVQGQGSVKPELKRDHIGKEVTFTFIPEAGWVVKEVYIDGVNQGAIETYTYTKLTWNSRIEVIFTPEEQGWVNFTDVSETDWFCEGVSFVISRGLFNGTGERVFSPNEPMTRAMLVTVLYRMEGQPTVLENSGFEDVKPGQWYSAAIAWASQEQIILGYSASEFRPDEPITREQAAIILFRYARAKGLNAVTLEENLQNYVDGYQVSAYAIPAMNWAVGSGLINGVTNDTLLPQGYVTRAQIATILMRFLQK